MNTYSKYCPNVFVAKCSEEHEKGSTITLTTKYGKEHDCIVFNLVSKKDGYFFYSIVRADGFNVQEWAKRKAEKLQNAAFRAKKKSDEKWEAASEGKDFLVLAEPIKIGHHSEKRHRALIQRNHDRMNKSMELLKEAERYDSRADYWEKKAETINLSMPESLEYFEYRLQQAIEYHQGLKDGKIERSHSFSLTYANKEVKELKKKVVVATALWGE